MSKKWVEFDFENIEKKKLNPEKANNLHKTSKAPTTRKNTKKTIKSNTNGINNIVGTDINFFKELEPQSVDDLAVHKKKILEVEQWLQSYIKSIKNEPAILLLTGPAGCGKTITLKVLCKSVCAELNEWTNPVDLNFESYRKQNDQFREFLFESKYKSLFVKMTKRISLVKDVPNIFVRDPKEFHPILEQYFVSSNGPIIFICTDVASSNINIKDKLFPEEIRQRFSIENISFNPTSTTLLKSALKRAEMLVKSHSDIFKCPEQHIVDSIIASSSGDIRCVLNQYYFACLPGTSNLPIDINIYESQSSKRKRGNKKTFSHVKQMAKDEVLGLFHSIGRVLNPKWQENATKSRINCDINVLVDEFLTYPNAALGFLQENYPKHFGKAQDVCEAADILSFSQKIVEKWYQNYTDNVSEGLWIAVLGLMVSNTNKITAWNPIRGPKKVGKGFRNHEESIISNTLKMDSSYIKLLSEGNKTSKYSCLNNKFG